MWCLLTNAQCLLQSAGGCWCEVYSESGGCSGFGAILASGFRWSRPTSFVKRSGRCFGGFREETRQRDVVATQEWTSAISVRIPALAQASFGFRQLRGNAECMNALTSKARPPVPVPPRAKAPGPVAAARDEGPPRPPDWTHAEEARPAQLRACAAAQAAVDGLIRELRVARVSAGSEASAIRSDKRFGSEAIGDCDCYPRRWMIRGHWNPRRLRFRGPEAIAIRGDFRFRCRCDPRPLESEAIGIRGHGNPVGPDSNPIRL